MTETRPSDLHAHYTRVAIVLHWLIGLAVLGQMAFGFRLDDLAPRGTPVRAATVNLHKSIGMVLFVLIATRLLWRLRHAPPAWPASMPAWQHGAARWGHRALYACMVTAPLAGYTASNFSKHGVRFFGLRLAPWGPDVLQVYDALNSLHVATAWLFTVLVVGHVGVSLKHSLIDRDGVFSRMWPGAVR